MTIYGIIVAITRVSFQLLVKEIMNAHRTIEVTWKMIPTFSPNPTCTTLVSFARLVEIVPGATLSKNEIGWCRTVLRYRSLVLLVMRADVYENNVAAT
jgi:hypothetical protein